MENLDIITGMSMNRWVELGMAISLMGVGYIAGIVKKHIKRTKKSLTVSWNCHSQIHELLTELRVKSDCARAQIVQFHNGEYFMDGISMKKLSLTHESLAKGVSRETGKMSNVLISLFTPLMEKILKNNSTVYKTTDEDNSIFKQIMIANNTIAFSVLPLRHRTAITGYIILEWCNEYKVKRLNFDEITTTLTESRNLVEIYLKDIFKEENTEGL